MTSCIAEIIISGHHTPVYSLRWDLANFFPRLASNCDPPNPHLVYSWDYTSELPLLALKLSFFFLNQSHLTIASTFKGLSVIPPKSFYFKSRGIP
jgi:hypothetical protein